MCQLDEIPVDFRGPRDHSHSAGLPFLFAFCIQKRIPLANTKMQIPRVNVTGQGRRVEVRGTLSLLL